MSASRPNFLVAFHPSVKGGVMLDFLREHLKVGENIAQSEHHHRWTTGGTPQDLYLGLGVAAVSLTPEQKKRLEKVKDLVRGISPNQARSVPHPSLLTALTGFHRASVQDIGGDDGDSGGDENDDDAGNGPGAQDIGGDDGDSGGDENDDDAGNGPGAQDIGGDDGDSGGDENDDDAGNGPGAQDFQGHRRPGPESYPWLQPYLSGQLDAIRSLLARLARPGGLGPQSPQRRRKVYRDTEKLTWALQALGLAPDPHTTRLPTGRDVIVAVLDTGLDLTHPDFLGRVSPGRQRSLLPGVASVQDGHGHGTHCCGIIAGPQRPRQGPRYGVAPGCQLVVGKVLDDRGHGWDSEILHGIHWAIFEQKARIVNLSLGQPRGKNKPVSHAYETVAWRLHQPDPAIATACAQGRPSFSPRHAPQALLVAAAGNASHRPARLAPVEDPAASPAFLAIAALDAALRVAGFSCAQVDPLGLLSFSAPGVGIHSSLPVGHGPQGANYGRLSGTSMAAPHITGLAALYLERSPHLSPAELRHRLEATARPLGPVTSYGRGLGRWWELK